MKSKEETMSNPVITTEKEKPSWTWWLIKKFFMILFPGFQLLKINSLLKKSNRIYKHPWFAKQRLRNLIVSFLVSSPIFFTGLIGGIVVYKDPELFKNLKQSQEYAMKFEIGKAWDKGVYAVSNDKTVDRMKTVTKAILVGALMSFILGTLVVFNHSSIQESKVLYDMLQRNGIIERDDKSRTVLATPLGFLIDITGNTAKEVKDNERIWMALNQRVTDWAEDADKRALVFFKKSYQLKDKYIYDLKELNKHGIS